MIALLRGEDRQDVDSKWKKQVTVCGYYILPWLLPISILPCFLADMM